MIDVSQRLSHDPRRRVVRDGAFEASGQCVIYWMQRAQRGRDNPALNLAIEFAQELRQPVLAAFGLTADYPGANLRHYRFLVDGLPEIAGQLARRGVPLVVRLGRPDQVIERLAVEARASIVVGDENPVRAASAWRESLAGALRVPFVCVDADVVVPSALFPREEYAARTIRPKIHKVWDQYLQRIPNPRSSVAWEPAKVPQGEGIEPDSLLASLNAGGVSSVAGYRGGPAEAGRRLQRFIKERLRGYAAKRNQPSPYHTSELSAHLHFGHVSPVTVALAARESGALPEDVDAFLEELIVRRELAINYVARNRHYDRLSGCADWAIKTLEKHAADARPHLYTARALENAETHDELWNAAQREMAISGRMHNYLRMYWAKKILEWSPDAATAFAIAVELNDRYELDGRDPNGYAGVAWAIGGKHDRPWPERPIYGTIRSMTYAGMRKKIDIPRYIGAVAGLTGDATFTLESDRRTKP